MVHFNGAEDRNRTGTRGKSRRILSPVRLPVPPLRHTTWLRATLPGGCPPSTIAAKELNFCVRYGNRWILFAIITTMDILRGVRPRNIRFGNFLPPAFPDTLEVCFNESLKDSQLHRKFSLALRLLFRFRHVFNSLFSNSFEIKPSTY